MRPFVRKPLWYKDAVIYEAHVKGYHDSDDDGMGDFRGLIAKLDYIRDLGVDTIWLLPFYPSPLRDDGYDIADYRTVNPAYGTLAVFREFLDEAHARGIHVVTEVVINHTSDRHPWFERARRAPPGSPERNFYVWSQSKEKYAQARIIFQDFEPSNWTWDPVAKSHFWHRFYHHQPDLNFDNPAVHDAVLQILDYWLEMGVDGLRLDAIPYLYEREGTSCENLPETHAFLRKLSAHVHAKFENRMLLAEANQWPDDAAAYFGTADAGGTGDACDMAFHFPLMTRLYMAVETEDRFPIVDILDQTPAIPENSQWAIFLRNHDELTLEMVTDEERDYMVRVFAKDRRARVNLGIRRRLAPLLGNNRRKIELMNSLLFSLPGTPVIYYGDEIGMGDNIYLGDRDGVRTPMQWSADRNAGFSRASAQRLYLPVIADSEHHYEAVNVEAQEANPSSLLWWMRRRIRLRRAHPVFGRGTIRFLEPENGRMLAFVRENAKEAILVIANLSQHPQAARLDLADFRGAEPLELGGGARFPVIGGEPWPVMLGGYDCLWLLLRSHADAPAGDIRALPDAGAWDDWRDFLARGTHAPALLEAHTVQSPWFAGKSRLLSRVLVHDVEAHEVSDAALVLLRAEFLQGEPEDYSLWLAFVPEADAEVIPAAALIARVVWRGVTGLLCEAQHVPAFRVRLLERLLRPVPGDEAAMPTGSTTFPDSTASGSFQVRAFKGAGMELVRVPHRASTQLVDTDPGEFRVQAQGRLLLRWFRRVREEARPDLEILQEVKGRFPKARAPVCLVRVDHAPALNGARKNAAPRTLGYVQRYAHAERTAGDLALEGLQHFLREAATAPTAPGDHPNPPPSPHLFPPGDGFAPARLDFQTLAPALQDFLGGPWAEFVFLLGQRLAELHRHLARCGATNPDFAPEPFSLLHQHGLYHSIRGRVRRALASIDRIAAALPDDQRALAESAAAAQPAIQTRLRGLIAGKIEGQRLRIHGDPRLDRILFTGKDFVFTSFDGPPWLAVSERAFRFSPLHDLAALIRDLRRHAAESLSGRGEFQDASGKTATWAKHWANQWAGLSVGLLIDGYFDTAEGEKWLPSAEAESILLLEAFLIERLAFEVQAVSADQRRAADALQELARLGVETGV